MVRNIKYDHNKVVTGAQDAGKQVSKDEWNDGHNETGMFGHGTVTTLTIATGAIVPVNSMHIVDGEGAANDDLDNLTVTETSDRDELWLIKGAQIITVRDNSVSTGNIFLLNGSTSTLDANKPMRLIRSGTNWYEFAGAGSGIFLDSNFLIQDDGDVSKEWDSQLSGATTSTKTTLAFSQTLNRTITYPDATDTLVGKATADVFTNKDILSTTNRVNVGTFEIAAEAEGDVIFRNATVWTRLARGTDNQALVATAATVNFESLTLATHVSGASTDLTDTANLARITTANIFGDFAQTFKDNRILIESPDGLTPITIVNLQQTLARNLTIPILTGSRNIAVVGEVNQFTNTELTSGVFAKITGIGVQTQALDMDGNDIILDVAGNIRIDNSAINTTTLKHSTNFPTFTLLRDQLVGDGSTAGKLQFRSKDDSTSVRIFGEIKTIVEDTTVAGSLVHGSLHIRVMDANVETPYMNFNDAKSGQIDILKNLNLSGNNADNIQNLIHDQSVSGTDIDFSEDEVQTISISVNTTFTTANKATGKSKTLKIVTDGTLRTLDFPAWKFIGTKPADQAASKTGVLTVTCFGTADTDIVAAYAVEA